jgi:predicted O-methyltransferase YrrM
MKSSYLNKIDFGKLFSTIVFVKNPKLIVEIGILDGFSLKSMVDQTSNNCDINAYDLFDDFIGNHSNYSELINTFKNYNNVKILFGNFFDIYQIYNDNSIDILHIDIANDGDIFEFMFKNYIQKMNKNGLIIMEGGSLERDNIEWMTKFNKKKIIPVLEKYNRIYNIFTIPDFPSVTLIKFKE